MTVKEAKKYIKKLGLEKAHNAIKRAVGDALYDLSLEMTNYIEDAISYLENAVA